MEVQCKSRDRISALPQDTIEKILTHMPIRDAVKTCILSKTLRYCWTRMPKLEFDGSMVVSSDNEEIDRYKFVKAIFQVLLLRRAPISEFSLIVDVETFSEVDQIIPHLSRSDCNIKKFIFGITGTYIDYYPLPSSFFSLQGLEHLDLSYCVFDRPLMNNEFSMLKSLCFYEVYISGKILQGFLTNCPLLEKFTWITGYDSDLELIEREWVELLKCLPSVQVLEIYKLNNRHLDAGSTPHNLPISLPHLKKLVLEVCFLEISFVLHVISSSPNLEEIKLMMCWNHDGRCLKQTFNNVLDPQDYSGLTLDHLKELEITRFHNHAPEMEFVKLIMAKSPVLKKARLEINSYVSVDEEVKMLRDVLHIPFLRASPLTIERHKY